MKFLMVSRTARHAYVLNEILSEGHDVLLLTANNRGDLVPTTLSPKEALDWNPDVVLFFDPGMGTMAKVLQEKRVPTFGGGLILDMIHNDKEYLSVLASRARIPIYPLEDPKAPTLRLAVCFSGKGVIHPTLAFGIEKDLAPGIQTRREGVTIIPLDPECPLLTDIIPPLEKVFNAFSISGWIFMEIHLVEKYPGSSEMTPHIHDISVEIPDGFFSAFLAGLQQKASDFFSGAANKKRFSARFLSEPTTSIKVSLPPYPNIDWPWLSMEERYLFQTKMLRGCSGLHVEELPFPRTQFFLEVCRNGSGKSYHTIGPEVCFITANGDFQSLPYIISATIRESKIPNAIFKTQPGSELIEALARFADHGLVTVQATEKKDKIKETKKEMAGRV